MPSACRFTPCVRLRQSMGVSHPNATVPVFAVRDSGFCFASKLFGDVWEVFLLAFNFFHVFTLNK